MNNWNSISCSSSMKDLLYNRLIKNNEELEPKTQMKSLIMNSLMDNIVKQ